jgi:hypothetical protein
MSTSTAELGWPRVVARRRLARALRACPAPVGVFLASRLIVLASGTAAALLLPRRDNWMMFDPGHVSDRLGALGNMLGAVAVRWDSIHYLAIAAHGYRRAADTVFFPLYPLLIHALGSLTGSTALGGAMISTGAFALALILMHRLTRLELGERAADAAVLLLAFAPVSLFFSAVYTESPFLALSVGAVYAARRGRGRLAAALGALAAVTRVTGVLLVIPLAIGGRRDRRLAWLIAIPAALAAYLGFVAAWGFGALAPFLQQTAAQHEHSLTGPLDTVLRAGRAALHGLRSGSIYAPSLGGPFSPGVESILLLAVLALAVLSLAAAFRRLPIAYGAYAATSLLVCISSPVAGQPLRSLDRYTLTIFPLWMAAAAWLAERKLTATAALLSGVAMVFFAFEFATWAFIA